MATSIEKRVFSTLDKVKERIAKANETLLQVSNETVEGALEAGKEWQSVMKDSIKKGAKLVEAQKDLTFEALEGIKAIHLENRKRFRQLVKDDVPAPAKKAGAKAAAATKAAKKVVEETATAAKKQAKATTEKITDLKTINGIGPKLESILNEAGIQSITDIVATPVKQLEAILAEAGPRYKAFSPAEWKKQAKEILG